MHICNHLLFYGLGKVLVVKSCGCMRSDWLGVCNCSAPVKTMQMVVVMHCHTDRMTETDVQGSSPFRCSQSDGHAESCTPLDAAAEQCESLESG